MCTPVETLLLAVHVEYGLVLLKHWDYGVNLSKKKDDCSRFSYFIALYM